MKRETKGSTQPLESLAHQPNYLKVIAQYCKKQFLKMISFSSIFPTLNYRRSFHKVIIFYQKGKMTSITEVIFLRKYSNSYSIFTCFINISTFITQQYHQNIIFIPNPPLCTITKYHLLLYPTNLPG